MKYLVYSLMLIVCAQSSAQVNNEAYAFMIDGLLDNTVPLVSCAELDGELKANQKIIVFDARERNEFAVSHIDGAIWVGYDDFAGARVDGISRDMQVVVYCSVGYRSEKIGEKLRLLGFDSVSNLHGGIFEWMNQERKVVDSDQNQTTSIHAYNKGWGVWVTKGNKVYE